MTGGCRLSIPKKSESLSGRRRTGFAAGNTVAGERDAPAKDVKQIGKLMEYAED